MHPKKNEYQRPGRSLKGQGSDQNRAKIVEIFKAADAGMEKAGIDEDADENTKGLRSDKKKDRLGAPGFGCKHPGRLKRNGTNVKREKARVGSSRIQAPEKHQA
ncbi:MAG TPA: hypothetical protein VME24_12170 [Alphaproteobacteria bacterium]|nr:hypothetical protein [Alphaproteobacteria bacterium]